MLHDTCYVRRGFTLQNFSKKNLGGFTLIELILYVGLAAVMILAVSIFLSTMLQSRVRNQTVLEVESQGIQVMQRILQVVRNSLAVNSPLEGLSDSSLSMDVLTLALNPTIFDISGGVIRMHEGLGTPIPLTSSRVIASNLIFRNLSKNGTPGTIQLQFTLTHLNQEGRYEYDYSEVFIGSATLKAY